jgi:tyrosinase
MAAFERRDVWVLSAEAVWHPTIEWYAKAIRAMKQRDTADLSDPTSFAHLAAIHGTDRPKNTWPAGAKLHECQHSSWFFLPWHRIFLHHYEKIVRATVVELGGPTDWALPYWNYSDPARSDARKLPPAFRRKRMPDNKPNPLFINERGPQMNVNGALATDDVDIEDAMLDVNFTEPDDTPGFGGPVTDWWHGSGPIGSLEGVPHGSVHMGVGGVNPRGLMSGFNTAGLNPIFWLHHANIDRLWEVWLGRKNGRTNPTDTKWLNHRFSMGTGAVKTEMTVKDVLDTKKTPLRYRYADMPPAPPAARRRGPSLAAATPTGGPKPRKGRPAEPVGATSKPVPLGTEATSAEIELTVPSRRRRTALAAAGPPRVFLKLENVSGTSLTASSYNVFVNVPAGASPADHPDRRAGRASMFGVVESSGADPTHSGSGLTFSFEITDLVRRLEEAGDWDPTHLRVAFVPVRDAAGELYEGDVTIGRVSVYYA